MAEVVSALCKGDKNKKTNYSTGHTDKYAEANDIKITITREGYANQF